MAIIICLVEVPVGPTCPWCSLCPGAGLLGLDWIPTAKRSHGMELVNVKIIIEAISTFFQ